jgi:predicted RNA-binding Zn-ribbon protein involved in translation (DUF1610 family)
MTCRNPREEPDVPSKSTLFCPGCEYQNRAEGDWIRSAVGQDVHYLCPDCGTDITVRWTGVEEL